MSLISTAFYDYDTVNCILTRRSTQQALICTLTGNLSDVPFKNGLSLIYQDQDFSVQMQLKEGRIDLNEYNLSYGAWRRLVFFLADAFPVATFMLGYPTLHSPNKCTVRGVILVGGWQNGVWVDDAMIQTSVMNGGGHPLDPPCSPPDQRFILYPLEGTPTRWEYHAPPSREGEAGIPEKMVQDAPTIVNPELNIPEQLASVPYFFQKERQAFLYLHHIEPEYHHETNEISPTLYYGYITPHVMFTMRAHSYFGIDTFLDWALLPESLKEKGEIKSYYPLCLIDVTQRSRYLRPWDMPPICREEFFFDIYDIQALRKEPHPFPRMIYSFPVRYKKQHEPEGLFENVSAKFGENLDHMAGLPFSIQMGLLYMRFAKFWGY
jgi:hypothetical protein